MKHSKKKLYCPVCKKRQVSTDINMGEGNCTVCETKWGIEVEVQPDWEDIGYDRIWETGHVEHLWSESEIAYGERYEE